MALKILSGPLNLGRGGGLQIKTSSAAFNPVVGSATLKMNLDFSTLSGADSSSIASMTDPISGTAFVQATGANQPLLRTGANGINGRNAGQFGANNSTLLAAASGLTIASGSISFLAVVNPTGTAGEQWIFDANTGRLVFFNQSSSATNQAGFFDGAFEGVAASTSGLQLLSWVLTSGGNGQVWRNGVSLGTHAYTAKAVGGNVVIGNGQPGASQVVGKIGQLLAYQGALSGADRASLEAGLKTKWGTP